MSGEHKDPEVETGEVDLVLRRAAEIQARSAGSQGAIGERDVKHLAEEIGISGQAVDQALVELRSGVLERHEKRGGLFAPRQIVCVRTVPGPAAEVEARVRDFLESQHFAVKRNFGQELVWRRERTGVQKVRAMFDAGKQKLEGCSEIRTTIETADAGAVRLVLVLELDELRGSAKANAWGGGLVFGGMALGAGLIAGIYAAFVWLPIGAAAAAGTGYGITRLSVSQYRKHAGELDETVQGFLDRLEHERPALPSA